MADQVMAFDHTFQSAAVANGNGTAMEVGGLPAVGVQVTGITTATVNFEGNIDRTNWVAVQAVNLNDGSVGTSTAADGVFVVPAAGLAQMRCRISGYSAGTITVSGKGVTNAGVNLADIDVAGTETVTLAAGENHIGEVGGKSAVVDLVLSLDTGAYASGDVLAATQELANAVRVNGGTGVWHSLVVQDDDDNAGALDVILMDTNTSIGTENSAVSMADNDTILGTVEVAAGDYIDMANSQHAVKSNIGVVIEAGAATKSLYVAVVSRDTKTYTASGITLRFGFLLD